MKSIAEGHLQNDIKQFQKNQFFSLLPYQRLSQPGNYYYIFNT